MNRWLREVTEIPEVRRRPVEPETLSAAAEIVEDVRLGGESALRRHGERLGDLEPHQQIVFHRDDLDRALAAIASEERHLLERVAKRVTYFAIEQRKGLVDLDVPVTGGRAGHRWIPVGTAGAYAPGGQHPLPSSVLMTVIPARVAGVETVWVASPRPTPVTMAATALAGADGLLAIGGAQAIAALAFGTLSPPCHLIVGPGNRWVTAAKKHLYGEVGIDGLAGPSEILAIADEHAQPALVAADLLAQAEHAEDAIPVLITTSRSIIDEVEQAITDQIADLPTSETASVALRNGFSLVVDSLGAAAAAAENFAPEHLAIHVEDPDALVEAIHSYGSLFVGAKSAETFADYGVGPNHVLPTGGGARFQSGLSVLTFLKAPTWSRIDDPESLVDDTMHLARLEGLEAHARAAQRRRSANASSGEPLHVALNRSRWRS